MHCKSCEMLIEENVIQVKGVKKVDASHVSKRVKIWYEESKPSEAEISQAIEKAGYTVGQQDTTHWFSRNPADYIYLAKAAAILFVLVFIIQMFNLAEMVPVFSQKTIGTALLIGLVAGVSSCMALIGGLVLALSARYSELHPEASALQKFRPHLFFNLGRILGFALFGGLIGLLGSAIGPSPQLVALLSLIVGAVMVVLGLKLLEIFPLLNKINITLPKTLARWLGMQNDSKEYSHKSAFVGGALTFFLPCGFTQSMQLFAISTGSFAAGAAAMSLFALGTAPGLLGIGGLSSIFKGGKARVFFAAAGIVVIVLGWYNISNARQIIFPSISQVNQNSSAAVPATGNVQEVRMNQTAFGYSPNQFTVKAGNTIRWIINSTNQYTCASYLSMPAYKIYQPLKEGENIIEFTPTSVGEISFSCSMGMYRGKFIVTN